MDGCPQLIHDRPPAAARVDRYAGHMAATLRDLRVGDRVPSASLGPQPLRDTVDASPEMAHSTDRPAPHVYIAYYLWLRNRFGADAMVHVGRHGTLEWLPGKDVVQSESDPGEVLIGAVPHLYYYLVDGGGEFLQAKRRSQAVIISHLTPLLAGAGLGPDYATLVHPDSLEEVPQALPRVVAVVAARVGTTRLIDNEIIEPGESRRASARPAERTSVL